MGLGLVRDVEADRTVVEPLVGSTFLSPWLVVLMALLVTPSVGVGVLVLHNAFLTFSGLAWLWVVAPAFLLYLYPAAWAIVSSAIKRGMRHAAWQAALGIPSAIAIIGLNILCYHFGARLLGLDASSMRAGLGSSFGLTDGTPLPDVEVILWLSLVNPVMEEFFWRVFVFELIRGGCEWWRPACGAAILYAMYHVPVMMAFLPTPLIALAFVLLIGLGVALQVSVDRIGLIFAVILHCSFDVVACILFADVVWSWGLEGLAVARRVLFGE